jgi:hypothetical protein
MKNQSRIPIYLITDLTLTPLIELLKSLDNDQYSEELPALKNNSVGKHVRHIIEFYECLLVGYKSGIVDYDSRKRNYILETDIIGAIESIDHIIRSIPNYTSKPLTLIVNLSLKKSISTEITSSWDRELVYNIEHAIHHMAIIGIGIRTHFPGILLPENFGVAPATIKFQNISVVINK